MRIHVAQWIGKRVDMEDAYALRHFPGGSLAVVCDGMGGHDCGLQAAELASRAFVKAFEAANDKVTSQRLLESLNRANDAVGEYFQKRGLYGGLHFFRGSLVGERGGFSAHDLASRAFAASQCRPFHARHLRRVRQGRHDVL